MKVTEQITNPIIVFTTNFKVMKLKVNRIEKFEVTVVVIIIINMQNLTIFELVT